LTLAESLPLVSLLACTLRPVVYTVYMVAINTNDIIAESTDLGDTVAARPTAKRTNNAAQRVAAILDRMALADLPCYGVAEHKRQAKVKLSAAHAIFNAERVARKYGTPTATRLNRRQPSI
jgi:hypothetical protein